MMRSRFWITGAISAAVLCVACLGKSTPARSVNYYTLDYPVPAASFDRQLPCVLRVVRFAVSPPYHTQRIIYGDQGLFRNAYAYQQWIAAPGDLLAYLLARDMRHSEAFGTVLAPDTTLAADYSVYGWVERFLEKQTPSGSLADLALHITLVSENEASPDERIVLQKSYFASADCVSATAQGLALAMSSAVEQLSPSITMDIYDGLANNCYRQ
jgi:ABC-type uncharacterized transport system auxiliary subunit